MNRPMETLKWVLLVITLCYLPILHAQIDLSILNPNITATSIPAGKLETVGCQLRNSGSSISPNLNIVHYYLSKDALLDSSDVSLGSRSASWIAANWSVNITQNITIPASTDTGSYFILLIADENNFITETDETNNTALLAITITPTRPDFRVFGGDVNPNLILPNTSTVVNYTIVNDGVMSDSIEVGFYLSTDNIFSANDVLVGTTQLDSLVQNGVVRDTATITIPAGTAATNYVVLMYVDHLNAQPELYETNNITNDILFVTLSLPDLDIRNTSLNLDTVVAGYSIVVSNFVDNNGGFTYSSSRTGHYLSTDTILDNSDVFLQDVFISNMSANSSRSTSIGVFIPTGTIPGNYYLISSADYQQTISESNENNNDFFVPLTVLAPVPDLFVSSFSTFPYAAMPGDNITIRSTLRNIGSIASPAATVKYYWSTNSSYDNTAILIDSITIPTLGAFQDHTYNFNYTLPSNWGFGGYYLIAYIDQDNSIAEFSETNNTRTTGITAVGTGPPDLTIGSIQANATTAIPLGEVEFDTEVRNLGQNFASGSMGYYWSTDTIFDNLDTYLGQKFFSAILPNGSETVNETIRIPNIAVYGTYYVLFFADHQNTVVEGDETNNVAYFPVVVDTLYKPDLTVVAYQSSPDTVQVGAPMYFSATVQNLSTSSIWSSNLQYALSVDTIFDFGDYRLRTGRIDGMGSFQTAADTSGVTIPATVPQGEYYVLFYADYLNRIAETDETNNVAYKANKVVIQGNPTLQTDLIIQNTSIDKDSTEAGDQVAVTADLVNTTFRTASQLRVSYYWSTDMLLDSTDVYLDSRSISILTNSNPRTEVQNLTIPTGLALGNYHVLVFIDDLQEVAESNEQNNIAAVPVVIAPPRPELSILSVSASPSTLEAGTTTTISYTVRNTGVGAGAGRNYTGYYLSSNSVLDNSDIYLGEDYIDTVDANGSKVSTVLLLIPSNTPAGSYYLIFDADHRNQQNEQDETNNTRSRSITVRAANPNLYADFVVQNAQIGNTTLAPSDVTAVGCNVRNIGSVSNNGFNFARLGFYLSPTPSYNSGMILLASGSIGTVASNTSNGVSTVVQIPAGTPAGNYYILYFADDRWAEPENNENNNIGIRSITITGTTNNQTDLIVNNPSINAPTTFYGTPAVPAGNTIDLTSTIRNLGDSTRSSFIGYYLSSDAMYSANDVYLGNDFVNRLVANGSSTENKTITIPVNTSTGSYYILFRADDQGQISERVETNNVVALPLWVQVPVPDLEPQNALVGVSTATAGDFVTVDCNMRNIGAGIADATNLGYYLSTVPNYTNAAVFLGASYVPSLAINANQLTSSVVPIPGTTPSGNYYLLFYADHQELELESDEANNVLSQAITIIGNPDFQPDIVVEYPSVGTNSLVVGNSTTVDCSIRNQGGITANPASTGYYLSTDTLLDNNDILVGSSFMTAINSNDTLLQTATITIPMNTIAGNYYLLYVADRLNVLIESNDTNNVVYLPLTVNASQADLLVKQAAAVPTAVFSGAVVNVSSWVHNQGSMAIANTALGYYLSSDTLYDNGDVYLNASVVDTLQAGDSSNHQLALTIPIATTTGNYYLLYYADHQVTRAESDKTNNIAYVSLNITEPQPDLRIPQANVSNSTITVGTSVTATAFLQNVGTAAAGGSVVGYYLSTDNVYSANDVLLTTTNNTGLGIGDSVAIGSTLSLPNTTTAGNYYILFYADYQNNIAENNETNNVQAVAVTVVLPLPDLLVSNAGVLPIPINPGSTTSVFCDINNNSIGTVGNHRVGYYLTTLPLFANAIPLADTLISSVAGNSSLALSQSITIPAGTTPGNYYILFYVDDQLSIAESNEGNNRIYIPITVTIPVLPDATVSGASVNPTNILPGDPITLSSTIRNQGTAPLSTSTLGYYLSPTPTYNSSTAQLLGNTSIGNIFTGSFVNRTNSFAIPSSVASGNYYILFYADAANTRTESDESNNIAAVAITIAEPLPDLIVQNPSAVYQSGNIQLSALVTNIGAKASGNTTLGYYLSTDPVVDTGDVLLGTDAVGVLLPTVNSFEDATIAVPAGVTDGLYFILFVADYLQIENEEDETNNTTGTGIFITININQLPTTELSVYPNPTGGGISIELDKTYQEVQIEIYNALGQLTQTTAAQTTANLTVDIDGPAGVYLLQISTREGVFKGIPIVKE
ncbi:MAG: CARDB domain-containing protein [Aureispira sp.]